MKNEEKDEMTVEVQKMRQDVGKSCIGSKNKTTRRKRQKKKGRVPEYRKLKGDLGRALKQKRNRSGYGIEDQNERIGT